MQDWQVALQAVSVLVITRYVLAAHVGMVGAHTRQSLSVEIVPEGKYVPVGHTACAEATAKASNNNANTPHRDMVCR